MPGLIDYVPLVLLRNSDFGSGPTSAPGERAGERERHPERPRGGPYGELRAQRRAPPGRRPANARLDLYRDDNSLNLPESSEGAVERVAMEGRFDLFYHYVSGPGLPRNVFMPLACWNLVPKAASCSLGTPGESARARRGA